MAPTAPGRLALRQMQGTASAKLVFPQGRYHFRPNQAQEKYLFPSNNDPGLKRIVFPLVGVSDIEIDVGGSEFIFHGRVVPFVLENSRNVRLTGFSMDWDRTFHNEGEVLDAVKAPNGLTRVDLGIASQFPYRVEYGRLHFLYEWSHIFDSNGGAAIGNLLEFDAQRRETASRVWDNYGVSTSYHAEEIEPGLVQLTAPFNTVPTPGNVMSIGGNEREFPGIVISHSRDVSISDVTLHHCGGMGVIAQSSENIRLERLRVTPSEREGRLRMISATADATHFVNCRGLIEMSDCVFENQLDDATNVHGIFGRIARVVSPCEVLLEWVHSQQQGMDLIPAGDTLEFVQKESLLTCHQSAVTEVERINSQFCRVALEYALPPQIKPGDAAASLTGTADVTIRRCTSRGNRARGFLLSTPGRVLVEDCRLHAPGAAIFIAGDASSWFESGGVRDVTIRNNHLDNCSYGVWGRACIEVSPEIEPDHRTGSDYHQNITVEGNVFDAFDAFDLRLLWARCVDGLTFRDNTICPSTAYPAPADPGKPFDIEDCTAVQIEDNRFIGAVTASAVTMTPS